jgi:hypothetical protein
MVVGVVTRLWMRHDGLISGIGKRDLSRLLRPDRPWSPQLPVTVDSLPGGNVTLCEDYYSHASSGQEKSGRKYTSVLPFSFLMDI